MSISVSAGHTPEAFAPVASTKSQMNSASVFSHVALHLIEGSKVDVKKLIEDSFESMRYTTDHITSLIQTANSIAVHID